MSRRLLTFLAAALGGLALLWALTAFRDETARVDRTAAVEEGAEQPAALVPGGDPGPREVATPGDDPAPGERRSLAVRCEDERGAPVPEASLWIELDLDGELVRQPAGVTDDAGRAAIEGALPARLRVVAGARGRRVASAGVAEPWPQELVLTLARAAAISGRVVDLDGAPATGARVLAWSATAPRPAPELARRALAGDPRVPFDRADARGQFALDHLPPNSTWTLLAATSSATVELARVEVGTADVELRVEPVLGVRVLLSEPGGRPVRLPDEAVVALPSPRAVDARAQPLGLAAVAAELMGVELAGESVATHDFLYTTRERRDSLRLAWQVALFGYEWRSADLVAGPLRDGLPVARVELAPLVEGRGELEITFDGGAPSGLGAAAAVGPGRPVVLLATVGADRKLLQLRAPLELRGRVRYADVPYGAYTLQVLAPPNRAPIPTSPLDVAIGPEAARASIDLGAYGAIEIAPRHADGEPYRGALSLLVMEGDLVSDGTARGGTSAQLAFPACPVRLPALAAGPYSIVVLHPALVDAPPGPFAEMMPGGMVSAAVVGGRTTALQPVVHAP